MDSQLVYQALEKYFKPWECTDVFPKMGLQYHNSDSFEKAYTATFTSDEVFSVLKKANARHSLLFTHHPVPQRPHFNGPPASLTQEQVGYLKESNISLFSYHIPLDRNSLYSPGNNLARAMGVCPFDEFYFQNGVYMGVLCNSACATLEDAAAALQRAVGHRVKAHPYGGPKLKGGRLAIMAGGASNAAAIKDLADCGINLLVTGMTNPDIEWAAPVHAEAKHYGVSLLGGTHYSTEKFALIAMTDFFKDLGLEAEFIPETPKMDEL